MNNRISFSGDIGFIGLADIFQILGGNSSTGTLKLTSPYTLLPGRIYFVEGNPVNGALGALNGLDAVYALFGWSEGRFEFREERVNVGSLIKQGRMQIVLDALRMLDDGVIKRVGAPSFVEDSGGQRQGTWTGPNDAQPIIMGPFIDYMHVINEEKVLDGERIVTEGCYGNWVWVVLEGKVKITKETENGPLTLAQLGEGCFIGMVTSFLFTEYMRSATVTALGDVYLGMLDTERLSGEYAALSFEFRKLLISLSGRLKKITDRTVDLLLKKDQARNPVTGGQIIMSPEYAQEDLFAIAEGEGYLMGGTEKGAVPLLTLAKEDFFGHLPFLDLGHEPYAASVLGSKDIRTYPLNTARLQREYDRLSTTFKNMIENIGSCISITTRMASGLGAGERPNAVA